MYSIYKELGKVTKKSPEKKNFAKKTLLLDYIYWIYSSAWLERIPDKDEVVSSNLTRPTAFIKIYISKVTKKSLKQVRFFLEYFDSGI